MAAGGKGVFHVTEWRFRDDLPAVDFFYHCETYGAFRETVMLPGLDGFAAGMDPIRDRIISLLHSVLGVSYYKAAAAQRVEIATAPADAPAHALIHAVYEQGLGEFFVRNALPFPYPLTFAFRAPREASSGQADASGEVEVASPFANAMALVGFGGGKDSYVAMDVVKQSVSAAYFFKIRVHMKEPVYVADPGDGLLYMDRFLDPALRAANAAGALNGHVPVTAINSLIALLAARVLRARHVIFANERSADEDTALIDGHGVNHQYSKTFALETLMADAVSRSDGAAPNYFSLLRPVSELWIARHLAGLPHLHDRFMSCNRNFRIGNTKEPTWCGECPKCAFTYLLMSPFIPKARLMEIFRSDLLDKPGLLDTYEELVGLRPVKPWECVGTVEECRTVMMLIARRPEWAQTSTVAALMPRLRADDPGFDEESALARLFSLSPQHHVPEPFLGALEDAARQPSLGVSAPAL